MYDGASMVIEGRSPVQLPAAPKVVDDDDVAAELQGLRRTPILEEPESAVGPARDRSGVDAEVHDEQPAHVGGSSEDEARVLAVHLEISSKRTGVSEGVADDPGVDGSLGER